LHSGAAAPGVSRARPAGRAAIDGSKSWYAANGGDIPVDETPGRSRGLRAAGGST